METLTKKEYLPPGTILRTKKGNVKVMIIGYNALGERTGKTFDYGICQYPDGLNSLGSETINNEDIAEIFALGYYDKENEDVIKNIVNKYNIGTRKFKSQSEYTAPNHILPMGTIIRSYDQELYMIVDFLPLLADNTLRDYTVYRYPNGEFYDCINQDEITEVISMGFIDKKCYKNLRAMPQVMDRIKREHEAGTIKPEKRR